MGVRSKGVVSYGKKGGDEKREANGSGGVGLKESDGSDEMGWCQSGDTRSRSGERRKAKVEYCLGV